MGGLPRGNKDLPNCVPVPAADKSNQRDLGQAQELLGRFTLNVRGEQGVMRQQEMAPFEVKNFLFFQFRYS